MLSFHVRTVYMHEHFSFSYILIRLLPDDPEFARPDIGHFILWSGIPWDRTCCKELESLSTYSGILAFLYSYYYSLVLVSQTFHLRSYVDIICIIAVMLILHSDYIASSCYFRLSVYAWGIFLQYICRWLSSRVCFPVFWKAGRGRVFLVLDPGSTYKKNLIHTCNLRQLYLHCNKHILLTWWY